MKVAIFLLAVFTVANANPAADEEWHWISPMPKVSPNPRALPYEDLAKYASPRKPNPRFGKGKTVAVPGCGLSTPQDSKIVGGTEATPNAYPWQVALYIDNRYFCGGSLISDEWVLTAAHCTTGSASIEVVMGAHNRLINEPTQVTMTSNTIITHENYGSILLRNDVGLVKLPTPVTLTNAIRPICLPSASDPDVGAGVDLIASGWGITADGGTQPANLREVTNPSISNAECANFYGATVADATICTETSNGNKGTCSGDSGGPLALVSGGTYYSRGVTSFVSSAGCESGNPDGFTRTKYYLDWITANTGIATF